MTKINVIDLKLLLPYYGHFTNDQQGVTNEYGQNCFFSSHGIPAFARIPKWIKQHLRIKSFFGTSQNAVKTQIWIAISVYVLVAIIKKRLNIDYSLYAILQVLSLTPFEKAPLAEILSDRIEDDSQNDDNDQLRFDF